jgi:hypothetical protein
MLKLIVIGSVVLILLKPVNYLRRVLRDWADSTLVADTSI